MRRYLAGLALASALWSVAAVAQDGPPVTQFTLDNGLTGIVIEDHRAPVVTNMVWYRAGAADEPWGKSGIAHFLEHLMFKGTNDVPEGEFSKIIAENGGQDNAFTTLDYTAYFQNIAADRLDLVMKMEADRMRGLTLSENAVTTERKVILEERNQRIDNNPQAKFAEQMSAALYLNHPYGIPVIGWRSEMEKLSREDALAFYRRFYAPDNAVLVVAGDVDPAEVEALARKRFGSLKPSGVVAYQRPQEPPQLAARRLAMSDPRVRQPYVSRIYLVPSYRTGASGQGEALALAAEILGGGVNSRFGQALVVADKIALNAGAYYSGIARDATRFGLYAVPVDGVSLARVEAGMDAQLAAFAKDGPTAKELERAKAVMVANEIYEQDSQAAMARNYGAALAIGLTVADVQGWAGRIEAVTADQVRAAAQLLKIEQSTTGWLTGEPAGNAEKTGKTEETRG